METVTFTMEQFEQLLDAIGFLSLPHMLLALFLYDVLLFIFERGFSRFNLLIKNYRNNTGVDSSA